MYKCSSKNTVEICWCIRLAYRGKLKSVKCTKRIISDGELDIFSLDSNLVQTVINRSINSNRNSLVERYGHNSLCK